MAAEGNGDLPVPDLRTMEELCQPTLNGQGGPIALIAIQTMNFRLKNDMIQQVQNSFQFYGLLGVMPTGILINSCMSPRASKRPEECYDLIENMTAHQNDWDASAQRSESSSYITSSFDMEIAALKAKMVEINKNLMRVLQVNQQVKAITPNFETCGGPHSFSDFLATVGNTQNVYVAGAYQAYQAPAYQALVYQALVHQPRIPQPQVFTTNEFTNFMKANDAILKNMQTNMTSLTNSNLELKNMFGQFMKMNTASSSGSGTLPGNTITNPKEDMKGITTRRGTAYPGPTIPTSSSSLVEHKTKATKDTVHPTNNGSTEDVQPLVVPTESPILTSEPVISPIIEPAASPVSAPKPNQRPSIPYPSRLQDQKLPLADLDANNNLMPLSVWNKLSLSDLSPTCMTLELADRLISHPVGVAEDVFVKVGTFHFSADFIVVNFDVDPRVPLILGRSFLKTGRALIDIFEGELTLCVGKEAMTFNLDQTSRYSANYNDMTANQIDVIDMACEEYSQEVLGFSDVIVKVDAFLALEDDPTSPEVDQSYLCTEGDILLLEAFLNDDPSLPPPNQGNYMPEVRKELKIREAKSDKSSIDEPPEVELKDLPPHLEYAFLEGDEKFPVIIAKYLSVEEKTTLITVLKSDKRVIGWKLFDIKCIDPEFCTHKILMEEDFKPVVQHQRRLNPKIHDVIKNEVLKLLDAGLIYPVSNSPWVSPVHCVPKKGATHKDHFPLPFMDQVLERLAGNQYYCIFDGFSGYLQIPIDPKDQEKTTFTCPYGTLAYRRMPFGLCNAPGTFQRCMMAIFHDMIKKTMEVFMGDFSVFGNSFQSRLSYLERCEDTNLCLN
nr:retrovirus-related Pol polyprotein from transposon 17.6 [Tanacetum cinerariifolium]GEZ68816.1 retrovirus-related Pol polyprotein from transposon 17.6 [Tanacetum cinerariifolium]